MATATSIELADGKRIELLQGDLTRQQVDAIVNAANEGLWEGGGVCGAIHRAGGPEIARECAEIVARSGRIATGQAAVTTGGRLPARWVIHAVGPVWKGGDAGEPELLASCHRTAIRIADDLGLGSIAFPAISTGIFGYPIDRAAPVALGAAREALESARHVRLVRFVLYDGVTYAAYAEAAERLSG